MRLRRARERLVAVVAAIALVVMLGGFWWLWTGTVVDDLAVTTWRPACTGATVEDGAIRARPGMVCTVTVVLRNDSQSTIRLHRLRLPSLGSAGNVPVRLAPATAALVEDDADGHDIGLPIGRDLAGGDTWEVELRLRFRASECQGARSDAGVAGYRMWPTVEASYLGHHEKLAAENELEVRLSGAVC